MPTGRWNLRKRRKRLRTLVYEMNADEIFKEFKEQSVSEFFRKNSQMLGYSGKVRSLTTAVHEYVTNSYKYAQCGHGNLYFILGLQLTELHLQSKELFLYLF